MGDEDGSELQALLQGADVAAHLDTQVGIKVGQGFIEQQHLWLDNDGTGDGHPLLLASGKL